MRRLAIAAGLLATLCMATSWGQDASTDESGTSLADQSPAQNVKAGQLQSRAPGTWVNAARARHKELTDLRVNTRRFGDQPEAAQDQSTGTTSGSTSSSSTLGSLLSQISGSGLLGSLSSLLGGTGSSTTAGSTGTSTATGSSTSAGSNVGDIPPEALAMIEAAGIDISELLAKPLDDGASADSGESQTKEPTTRSQTQDDRKFHVRLVDSLLSTLFTALAVGLQTSEFIDGVKGLLRPIFVPTASADTATDGGGGQDTGQVDGGTGDGTTDGATDGAGDTSGADGAEGGGGIEDLAPSDGEPQETESII